MARSQVLNKAEIFKRSLPPCVEEQTKLDVGKPEATDHQPGSNAGMAITSQQPQSRSLRRSHSVYVSHPKEVAALMKRHRTLGSDAVRGNERYRV